MAGARVLVTGSGGFLGGYVARHLISTGCRVVATGRSALSLQSLQNDGIETVPLDLSDPIAWARLAPMGRFDAIVHCAGLSSNWGPRRAFAIGNIETTANGLHYARHHGAPHFVYVSSPSVTFQFCDQLNVREDQALPRPVNAYAWSKAAAETLVRSAHDLPTTILRPRGIYGNGDKAMLPRLIKAAARGPLPLIRDGAAVIDLTYVDDVASAIAAVLAHRAHTAGATYNVSGGEPLPVRDIISHCAQRAGITVSWRKTPLLVALTAARSLEAVHRVFCPSLEPIVTAHSVGLLAFSQTLDLAAIRRDTGWQPQIRFDAGLSRTFSGSRT